MSYSGNINIGSIADDKTGTPLRIICDNTNDNFNQIFNVDTDGSTSLGQPNFVLATGDGVDAEGSLTDLADSYLPSTVVLTSKNNIFSVNQKITGSTDSIQLSVKGNATQTNDLFLVEKNDGTDLFNVSNSGDITISNNIIVTGSVDGRDLSVDGTKLDTIETGANVTDKDNVKPSIEGAGLSIITTPSANDKLFISDVGGGNLITHITMNNALFNSTIPTPLNITFDNTADTLLVYDASGTTLQSPNDLSSLAKPILNNASITSVTPATDDLVLIQDVSDSNNAKTISIANLIALYNFNQKPYYAATAGYNITVDDYFVEISILSGSNVTLPPCSGNAGKIIKINNLSIGNRLVNASGSDLIQGSSYIQLGGLIGTIELVCNGTSWKITGTDKVLLYNSGVASATSSVILNNLSTATFSSYEVVYALSVSDDNASVVAQLSSDNGSTFISTASYGRAVTELTTSTARYFGTIVGTVFAAGFGIGNLGASGEGVSGTLTLTSLSGYCRAINNAAYTTPSGTPASDIQSCILQSATAVNALRLYPGSGTFSLGQDFIKVYGIF